MCCGRRFAREPVRRCVSRRGQVALRREEPIYQALAEHGFCPAAIGAATWSQEDLLGSAGPATSVARPLETALHTSAAVLDGLNDAASAKH